MLLLLWGCQSGSEVDETSAPNASVLDQLQGEPQLTARDSAMEAFPVDSGRCQYIEGAFNVPDAMEIIFGLYDKNVECSKWICKPQELPAFASKASGKGVVHTRAAKQYDFVSDGVQKVVLLTATLSKDQNGWENCHACAPILGAAMFTRIDSAWFVEAIKKNITEVGAWGELPSNNLVKMGPDTYGVAFDYGYTGQGTTLGGTLLIAFGDGSIQQVADIHTTFSNEGMFMDGQQDDLAYGYESTISFQPGDNTEIFDLVVATTGTRPADGLDGTGPVRRFQEQRTYVLHGGSYVLYDSVMIRN